MPGHKRGRYASLKQHLAWIIEHDPKAEQAKIAREGLRKDRKFITEGCGSPKVTGWLTRLHQREQDADRAVANAICAAKKSAERYTDLAIQQPSLVRLRNIAKSWLPWRLVKALWAGLKLGLLGRV